MRLSDLSSMHGRVEKETSLAKAVSITRHHKKRGESSKKGASKGNKFFFDCMGPPFKYGDGQGRRSTPYQMPQRYPQRREYGQGQGRQFQRPGNKPQFHEPHLPQNQANSHPSLPQGSQEWCKEVLEILRSFPPSRLGELGVHLDWELFYREGGGEYGTPSVTKNKRHSVAYNVTFYFYNVIF